MQIVIGLIVVVVVMSACLIAQRLGGPVHMTPDEERDYAYVQHVMSRRDFHAIREKNRKEKEEFGDGSHAPTWGKRAWNGHYTLHRGVWVDDSGPVPSRRELDQFREVYWKSHRVVRFTLVEGEQLAPYGAEGRMIRVHVGSGIPSEVRDKDGRLVESVPTVSVSPVDPEDGKWSTSFMGSLPVEMTRVEKIDTDYYRPPTRD